MAYIIQRKDRFYVVAYDGLDALTSKERRRWHPAGQNRHEAEQIATRIEHDADGATPVRGGPVSLGEFLTETWVSIKRRHVRATTSNRYAWIVDHYINPFVGQIPLRRLRADHLDSLYHQLSTTGSCNKDGLAPKTVHEVHAIIRSALSLAARRELVATNVAQTTNARHKRQTRKVPRSWTAQELATFLTTARSQRLYPSLHLAACTGMRRGEVVGLKWRDLGQANRRLSISRTLQSVSGRPVEFPVKTRNSRRCVDLDESTMAILIRWRKRLTREGLPHGNDDWMFVNTTGRFVNPESISQLFQRVQHGMPDLVRIRFHDLRHTHASLLIMDGAPVKVVSERLGHANVAFTMQTYQHLLTGMSAAAAQQFADLLAVHTR